MARMKKGVDLEWESASEYTDSASDASTDTDVEDTDFEKGLSDMSVDTEDTGSEDEGPVAPSVEVLPSPPTTSEDIDTLDEVEAQMCHFDEENAVLDSEDEELFDGNRAPVEFYRQNIQNLNVDHFRRKHYSKGTQKLIKNCENYWASCVCSSCSSATNANLPPGSARRCCPAETGNSASAMTSTSRGSTTFSGGISTSGPVRTAVASGLSKP